MNVIVPQGENELEYAALADSADLLCQGGKWAATQPMVRNVENVDGAEGPDVCTVKRTRSPANPPGFVGCEVVYLIYHHKRGTGL